MAKHIRIKDYDYNNFYLTNELYEEIEIIARKQKITPGKFIKNELLRMAKSSKSSEELETLKNFKDIVNYKLDKIEQYILNEHTEKFKESDGGKLPSPSKVYGKDKKRIQITNLEIRTFLDKTNFDTQHIFEIIVGGEKLFEQNQSNLIKDIHYKLNILLYGFELLYGNRNNITEKYYEKNKKHENLLGG